MSKRMTWYDRGLTDGENGECDAPMYPGRRSYEDYMEGNADGARSLEWQRRGGDYYGTRRGDA